MHLREDEPTGREKWRLAAKGVHEGALGANRPGKPIAFQRQLGQQKQMITISIDSASFFWQRLMKVSQRKEVEWVSE